jgi:hypothetical protein
MEFPAGRDDQAKTCRPEARIDAKNSAWATNFGGG